jgi:hypothetical protein
LLGVKNKRTQHALVSPETRKVQACVVAELQRRSTHNDDDDGGGGGSGGGGGRSGRRERKWRKGGAKMAAGERNDKGAEIIDRKRFNLLLVRFDIFCTFESFCGKPKAIVSQQKH